MDIEITELRNKYTEETGESCETMSGYETQRYIRWLEESLVKKSNDIQNVSKCVCCENEKPLTHCEDCADWTGIIDN